MSNLTKGIYGALIILIAIATTFYIALQGSDLQMKITKTSSTFYINQSGNLVVAGVENVYLYNGSKKLTPTLREGLQSFQEDNIITLQRLTHYGNVLINEKYTYDTDTVKVEYFPISHSIQLYNASGLTLQYEVSKLSYDGVARSAVSPESFGNNMMVEWSEGNYYSKISKLLTGAKLVVKYKVYTDYSQYDVKLFDPQINPDDIFNTLIENLPNGEAIFNVTVPGNVAVNVSLLKFSYYEVCGHVRGINVLLGQWVVNGTNQTYEYLPATIISKGKQSIKIVADIQDNKCVIGNTTYAHSIDWIPCFNYSGTIYCQNKWAWWNSTTAPEWNASYYPNYWSLLNNGSSTVRIKPIYQLQNNSVSMYGAESTPNDELGRCQGTNTGGVAYVTGKIGTAFNLTPATTEWIDIGTCTDATYADDYTIEFWINSTDSTSYKRIIGNRVNTGTQIGWELMTESGGPYFQYDIGAAGGYCIGNAVNITNGVFHHVVILRNLTGSNIYVDNVKIDCTQRGDQVGSSVSGGSLDIGRTPQLTSTWVGVIDELKIYDRVITASEISQSYNGGAGRKYYYVQLQNNYPYNANEVLYLQFENNTLDEEYRGSAFYNLADYTVSGKIGGAYDFELSNSDYMTIDDAGQGVDITSGGISIDFWYKPESISTTESTIICKGLDTNASEYCVWIANSSTTVSFLDFFFEINNSQFIPPAGTHLLLKHKLAFES